MHWNAVLAKLLFRELLVYMLPLTLFSGYVYYVGGKGMLFLLILTKFVAWTGLVLYLIFKRSNYLYAFSNVGYSLPRLVKISVGIDGLFFMIVLIIAYGIKAFIGN